jgi:hypothetical protein
MSDPFSTAMSIDHDAIENTIQQLLQNNGEHKWQLTKMEKLVINSIIQKITYAEAGAKYQYTESSFQNAASKFFKKLSRILGLVVNRHNLLNVVAELTASSSVAPPPVAFERLQANLWVNTSREKAQLISISYQSSQLLDIKEYLLNYSPYFQATCCLDVSANSEPEFLQSIGDALLVHFYDACTLLESINLVLQRCPTLLVLRFDSSARDITDRSLWAKYAEIIVNISFAAHQSCLLVIDQESSDRSLVHDLRVMIDRLIPQKQMPKLRMIVINYDVQVISEVLKTYLSR